MPQTFRISLGDRRRPLRMVVKRDGVPLDLSGLTASFQMTDKDGADVVAETSSSVTAEPTFTVTASATTDRVTAIEHAAVLGDQVVLTSTGTLPAGLATSTRYYVVDIEPNSFRLSLSPNGPVVNITDAGTGTHTAYIVGAVQYAFAANDVDAAGQFRGYFRITSGGLSDTYPVDGLPIEIVER